MKTKDVSKQILKHTESKYLIFFNKYKKIFLIFIIFFLIGLLNPGVKNMIILFVLFIIGAFSQIHQRFIQPSLGFECYLFGTVITGAAFGSTTGLIFGVLVTIAASAISGRMSASSIAVYTTIGLMGLISPLVTGVIGITYGGIILSIISSIMITSFFMFYFGSDIIRAIVYTSTNVFLNIFLFTFLGQFLFSLLI